jgi:hypothetical protein
VHSKLTAVNETLTLLRFPPGCTEVCAPLTAGGAPVDTLLILDCSPRPQEDIADTVDRVWSLQYVAPGPVCGSAGPLLPLAAPGVAVPPPPPFSHAVLFRYASRPSLDAFVSNLKVRGMLGMTAAKVAEGEPQRGVSPGALESRPARAAALGLISTNAVCYAGISTLCFEGAVPSELEAIFRRGGEWDAGRELVVALRAAPGAAPGDGAEFLQLTQQLATSSAFGAVQASSGACFSLVHHAGGGDDGAAAAAAAAAGEMAMAQPDVLLLARFQGQAELEEFLQCPPVAAMLEGDERAPLHALWAAALEVAPAAASSTSPQRGRGAV